MRPCPIIAGDFPAGGELWGNTLSDKTKDIGPLLGFGSLTAALYFLLFYFETEIVELTSKGGWSFLLPIAIAFAISYGHGNFTAVFWDWLGIKAKH